MRKIFILLVSAILISNAYAKPKPWVDINKYYQLDNIDIIMIDKYGIISKNILETYINPKANLHQLTYNDVLFNLGCNIIEKDNDSVLAILKKYLDWEKKAQEMDVSISKEIGKISLYINYKYNDNSPAVHNITPVTFSIKSIEGYSNLLCLEISEIRKINNQPGIKMSPWYFSRNGVETLITILGDETKNIVIEQARKDLIANKLMNEQQKEEAKRQEEILSQFQ